MPGKIDKIKIGNEKLDRRVKLTTEQKQEIKNNPLGLSTYKLAEAYNVSRRTIQFILDPEKHKQNLKRRDERGGWKQYYDKETHRKTVKSIRKYKKELLEKGLIKPQENE